MTKEPNSSHSGPSAHHEGLQETRRLSLWITAVVFTLFAAGTYLLGTFGATFIGGLDEQVGEIVGRRAREAYAAGRIQDADQLYRRALNNRFDNPRQKAWTQRDYGKMLIDHDRPQEAASVLRESVNRYPEDNLAQSLLCAALESAGDGPTLRAAAESWLERLPAIESKADIAMAYYYLGRSWELSNQVNEALDAYLHGAELHMESYNAYHAAGLLNDKGRGAEALALLDRYIPVATGWRKAQAIVLHDRVTKKALENG